MKVSIIIIIIHCHCFVRFQTQIINLLWYLPSNSNIPYTFLCYTERYTISSTVAHMLNHNGGVLLPMNQLTKVDLIIYHFFFIKFIFLHDISSALNNIKHVIIL